ncbi:unnamed protein product [Tuber melanosporum]|uniref:(Perigord truffle) hypothetical protein n=1 Tax=Tuber melanosporum (strain Mel28) TaxID=656061 RepID=D5GKN7_TUBMM|nr:uncharacterized protein GSTUM_00009672001 [Tuber melanosporum]CAZ85080.1 unnamed protein product [Tuber melanosporum]
MCGGELLKAHSASQRRRGKHAVAASKRKIRIALRDQRIFCSDCIKYLLRSGRHI